MLNAVLQRLVDERGNVHEQIDSVLAGAADEERDPSESEQELVKRQRSRLEELEPQIEELLRTEETRQSAADARAFLTRRSPQPVEDGEPPEGDSETLYRNFGQYARDEILTRFPLIAGRAGPGERDAAQQRLERAVANTLTADIPGLLPSQHMAQIIGVIDKSRPIVTASRKLTLNAGQITFPKITQRPIVGPQAGEKTELPSQKMTVAMGSAGATVYGGSGDLSWQDVVWSNPDALALWFDLAAEAYAQQTELAAATALTVDTGTPIPVATNDLAGWLAAITQAAGEIYSASKRRADTVACDIATGYTLLGMVGATSPVFVTGGTGSLATGTGSIAGLQIVISPGFPADYAIVGAFDQLLTAENPGAPVELRAVEPSIAGFEVGVVGAFVAIMLDQACFRELNPPGGAAATRAGGRQAKS